MRTKLSIFLLVLLAAAVQGQDPGKDGPANPPPAAEEEAKAPVEPPAWKMGERERKKFADRLEDYLRPRKSRQDELDKMQKFVGKEVDGHSVLEDVPVLVDVANGVRIFNPRVGKKGKVDVVEIRPEWHGFPGGIGTVKYSLYLPKKYDARRLWPVIFCLPDNKTWPDGKKYIEQVWTSRSTAVAENYLVVVPVPQAKGDKWTDAKSMARAMITLRHVLGTFDADKKSGGPASDTLRVFLDGGESAATVASRFSEMFAGAILRGCDGKEPGEPDLRKHGGLNGLPALAIYDKKKKRQREFATKLKAGNDASLFFEGTDKMLGDAKAIADWMAKLPPRNTQPRFIEYAVHDASFQRHYWTTVLEFDAAMKPAPNLFGEADRAKNEVRLDVSGITRCELFLNDAIVDLNREVRIVVVENDKEMEAFKGMLPRNLGTLLEELSVSNQPWRMYPAKYLIDVPQLRRIQAEKDAAAAKKKAEEEAKKKGDASTEKSDAAESSMQKKGK